jgi:hypothetical protein
MELQDILSWLKDNKDEKGRKAFEFLDAIFKSPHFESYITLKAVMSRWNKQLLDKNIDILSNDPDDKGFERAHKYLTEMTFYIKSVEELKAKMLPEELKKADERQQTSEQVIKKLEKKKYA